MPGRVAEVVAVSALATIVTVVIAAPVLRAPSERVFGMEIVGRHHDPFTVMEQFERPISVGVYSQPVTDITGALLARISGAVAAYNWLVLLSFPLSAAAAYLLARHLALSPAGATVAAMAYAFSPFHLAHAAYHPHIAQTQWMPLYLLALWRCLDRRVAGSGWLSWRRDDGRDALELLRRLDRGGHHAGRRGRVLARRRAGQHPRSMRRLGVTVGSLVLIAAAGLAYASYAAGDVVANRAAFAFPRADLFRYSAKWWSYLVPPVEHPLLGDTAHRVWTAAGVREGLLEQQVSLGWGIVALGLIAVVRWLAPAIGGAGVARARSGPRHRRRRCARLLAVAGADDRGVHLRPALRAAVRRRADVPVVRAVRRRRAAHGGAAGGHRRRLSPPGRDEARADRVRRARGARRRRVRGLAVGAVARRAADDGAPLGRRSSPDRVRVLDCTPLTQESASVQWLTGDRVTLLGGSIGDCTEPNLSQKLAANGYTHLLVRRDTADGRWFADHPLPDGLRVAARFDDGQVFAVTARTPAIYTAAMTGFFPREHDAEWSWRWMGADAAWTIVNTSAQPIVATLGLELSAFHRARRMEVRLDGRPVQTLVVEPSRRIYQIGPLTVPPGDHELVFHPAEAPTVAGDVIDNGDRRPLSFALGTWSWTVRGEQP